MRWTITALLTLTLAGCAGVRPQDLTAWEGQPVELLDRHPVFLTIPVVRTTTNDGTEIRDYINGTTISSCSQNGTLFRGVVDIASYNQFTSCSSTLAACHNIFYIKAGRVLHYTPIGRGGTRCFTDERTGPNFSGATDIR